MSKNNVIPGMDARASWKIRRRIVNATLIYCGVIIAYLVYKGEDTELNQTIANALVFLASTVIGSYLFSSTWDQRHKREVNSRTKPPAEGNDDAWN